MFIFGLLLNWSIAWIGQPVALLVAQAVGRSGWVGWVGWVVGLVGWLVAWLLGCLVAWLRSVGRSESCKVGRHGEVKWGPCLLVSNRLALICQRTA